MPRSIPISFDQNPKSFPNITIPNHSRRVLEIQDYVRGIFPLLKARKIPHASRRINTALPPRADTSEKENDKRASVLPSSSAKSSETRSWSCVTSAATVLESKGEEAIIPDIALKDGDGEGVEVAAGAGVGVGDDAGVDVGVGDGDGVGEEVATLSEGEGEGAADSVGVAEGDGDSEGEGVGVEMGVAADSDIGTL